MFPDFQVLQVPHFSRTQWFISAAAMIDILVVLMNDYDKLLSFKARQSYDFFISPLGLEKTKQT